MKFRPWVVLAIGALVILGGLALCGGGRAAAQSPERAVEIVFLDVGQGDAALITGPDGRHVLVDAGPRGSNIARYLRGRRIDTLDLVVASHNHADHIGGMREVFGAVAVKNYLENGLATPTSAYNSLVNAVARSGARVLDFTARTLTVGEMTVQVLPSPPFADTQNDRSVGLIVQFGEFRALFTGDAEHLELTHWVREVGLPRVSVVKVSHHGSWNGTTPALVEATWPSVAVISVGARNQYGHPSQPVLGMWGGGVQYLLRTDQDGAITVQGDSTGAMRISTERGARLRGAPVTPMERSNGQ